MELTAAILITLSKIFESMFVQMVLPMDVSKY